MRGKVKIGFHRTAVFCGQSTLIPSPWLLHDDVSSIPICRISIETAHWAQFEKSIIGLRFSSKLSPTAKVAYHHQWIIIMDRMCVCVCACLCIVKAKSICQNEHFIPLNHNHNHIMHPPVSITSFAINNNMVCYHKFRLNRTMYRICRWLLSEITKLKLNPIALTTTKNVFYIINFHRKSHFHRCYASCVTLFRIFISHGIHMMLRC